MPDHSTMDDLMEMFALPSWPEVNGMGRQDLEMHDKMGQSHCPTHDMLVAAHMNQQQGLCDALVHSTHDSSMGQSHVDVGGHVRLLPQGMQEAAHNVLRRISEGSFRGPGLTRSPSIGSSGSEISGCQQLSSDTQSPPFVALPPVWHQSYMGGVPSSPLGLRQAKVETVMLQEGIPNEAHLHGRRARDDEARAGGLNESMFIPICGAQAQQLRSTGQQPHSQVQVSHGVAAPPYASHTGLGQPQGAAAVVAGTARPRVRARRGQATDPHSIAERLRRERIAERMKALQELVPNANKTDKASMLDEIIEYVRFLQLQVKVFSMSRLSGTGAVVPLAADVPAEGLSNLAATTMLRGNIAPSPSQESMAVTERQVARLMEESMGSAMQFLQTKGLCLMPISLATAISSSNASPTPGSESGLFGRTDALPATIRATVNAAPATAAARITVPVNSSGDVIADKETPAINGVQNSREAAIKANGAGQSSSILKSGVIVEETTKTSSLVS